MGTVSGSALNSGRCFSLLLLLFSETRSHYVVQAGLELTMKLRLALNSEILLLWPPKCWDYKRAPPRLAGSCFPRKEKKLSLGVRQRKKNEKIQTLGSWDPAEICEGIGEAAGWRGASQREVGWPCLETRAAATPWVRRAGATGLWQVEAGLCSPPSSAQESSTTSIRWL